MKPLPDLFETEAAPETVAASSIRRRGSKASDSEILAAYAAGRSVWRAAKILGMCGQSVHERLQKLGKSTPINVFTAADDALLILTYQAYADAGKQGELAAEMGRTRQFLARQAKRLGLTNRGRSKPYLADGMSVRFKKWHQENPHPRGMLGKTHTDAHKDAQSQRSFDRWHGMAKADQIAFIQKSKDKWRSGWRVIGGMRKFYRSRWEANYARYLEWLRLRGEIDSWEHEPETFWFEAIRRGTRSYLPDFRVMQRGYKTYHEVKGWMDPKSQTKLDRMAKYHPHVEIVLVRAKEYKAIGIAVSRLIPDWE